MTQVLPAIIPQSFEDLEDKMFLVKGIANLVQIDVCDGNFVPVKCWPYVGDTENHFKKIIEESEGFPFWQNMDFEADLMVKNPENVAEDWIRAGAKGLILHIESSPKILDLVKELRKTYGYPGDSLINIEIGIALNIETPSEILDEFFKKNVQGRALVDFVQFMGIDKIGYQGQKFDKKVIAKIKELRKKYPDVVISVDGGVNFENHNDLVKAGANKLISGSVIYESENIKEAILNMRK